MTGPSAVVVIGVSGAGKSTIASAVAQQLGRPFVDADSLHPPANKAKMAAGRPLNDSDRLPWLDAVAEAASVGEPVVACSALRRRYRDRLLSGIPGAVFVQLDVSHDELERRLSQRQHEFMPPALLTSQLADLEPLMGDEPGVRIPADEPAADVVARILHSLRTTMTSQVSPAAPRSTGP